MLIKNIQNCRKSIFGLLGPAFSFKCTLSPLTQVHLWRTYNLPVALSGLAALPIRPNNIKSLTLFHNKILRGFLKLSNSSPTAALHFLLGELPIEAKLHMDTLGLFHNIWANPNTTVHEAIKYILKMKTTNSTTWSNHVEILCKIYGLPCPLYLLEHVPAYTKEHWKCLVSTKITVYFEKSLRATAANNSKMKYLNVELHGLTGRPHPSLLGIYTTQDAKKLRLHLKFLCGDFLTGLRRSIDLPGTSPACQVCLAPEESIEQSYLSHQRTTSS